MPRKRARKRLLKRELTTIAELLKSMDLKVAQELVAKEVDKEQHIHLFPDRKALWSSLNGKCSQFLNELILAGLNKFSDLFVNKCSKGSDRHMRLLLEWNTFALSYSVKSKYTDDTSRFWIQVEESLDSLVISDECRSAVVSSIFSALFTFIVHQRNLILDRMRTEVEIGLRQEKSSEIVADDDVTLYRLFGFSLHVCMRCRSRSCWSRSKMAKRYTVSKQRNFRTQLAILKLLIENDKSVIPPILTKQDRGRMKFPNRRMLAFCRLCSIRIKTTLNMSAFQKDGRKISKVTKDAVLHDEGLQSEFVQICEELISRALQSLECPRKLMIKLFTDLVNRVINTMMNSILQSAAMVTRISENKGVDADVALRDKLKVYATEKQSCITL